MTSETMLAQITHEAPAASSRQSLVLPVCCVCGLVREETEHSSDHERWVTPRTYRKTHGTMPADCVHTHTYCPNCFTRCIDTIRAG